MKNPDHGREGLFIPSGEVDVHEFTLGFRGQFPGNHCDLFIAGSAGTVGEKHPFLDGFVHTEVIHEKPNFRRRSVRRKG